VRSIISGDCGAIVRLCAQHAGLDERAFQKIILQRQLPDPRVKPKDKPWREALSNPLAAATLVASAPKSPAAPSSNCAFQAVIWFGCTSKNLRQFAQRLLTLQGRQGHLRLEGRRVVPACRLVIISPDARRYSPLSGGKSTYRSVQISGAGSNRRRAYDN